MQEIKHGVIYMTTKNVVNTKNTIKGKALFDKLYNKTDEFKKELKKPLIKSQIKRFLNSAYDNASNKIIDAELELSNLRSQFDNYDINAILETRQEITTCKELQVYIKSEYNLLFDSVMKKE